MIKILTFSTALVVLVLTAIFAGCSSTNYKSKFPGYDWGYPEDGYYFYPPVSTIVFVEGESSGAAPFSIKYWVWMRPVHREIDRSRVYPDKIEVNFGDEVVDVTEDALKFLKSPKYDGLYGSRNFDESLLLTYTFETPGVYNIISRVYYGREIFETSIQFHSYPVVSVE